ncbi:MAG TPA: DUF2642 domain-containing protein [Firmicutes bacterium]|nr:DUF2642 domain-containing protein [Candidatus Fermentithermobacillaceae bacterium]
MSTTAGQSKPTAIPDLFFYDAVFLQHLRQAIGSRIEVGLSSGMVLTGTLREVYTDHILLDIDQRRFHVRLAGIVFFAPV